ncbi:hypothetical protein DL765_008921 [Monosporascus sp. GIB2]|nr:hypothetical protein DL765_008921 [Monosporascus sp. GIB2]
MGAAFSRNEFPVEGRTVVITGGSSGMGLAVGRKLAEMGANVAIVARTQDKLTRAVKHIQSRRESLKSPCKAALRALSDNLSQEMNLYAAAYPHEPPIRVHTIFPAGILGESFDAENRMKCDLTTMLENVDGGQTAEVVAAKSIRGLEDGQELVTTEFLAYMVKRGMLGGSVRGGVVRVLWDWMVASLMGLVMVFVRDDMDRKTRAWGRKNGPSGMKAHHKQA